MIFSCSPRHAVSWGRASITAVFACLSIISSARSDEALEKAIGAVFRLSNGRSSGTCFLISRGERADTMSTVLVTAAHVFEETSESTCQLMLRVKSADETYTRREVSITIRDATTPRWKRHTALDIAAIQVQLPPDVAVTPLRYEQLASAAWVAEKHIRVGQDVWIPCYPVQLEANDAGWPILRHGTVASHPLCPVKDVQSILIDFHTFGGDSGAPVLATSQNGVHVVGLVSGMHRQTDKATLPLQELTFHTPLGLSIVMQAAFIRETIELLDDTHVQ
ncbi:MAG: trypsin-like serine peptidase [Pirellulaceae bacterium]